MALIDDFTNTNGTTLTSHDANWTLTAASQSDTGNWLIQSNELEATAFRSLYAYYSTSATDSSEITVKGDSADYTKIGPAVRMASGSEGYAAYFTVLSSGNYTRVEIAKDGAFFAQVTSLSYSNASDHTIRITATDNGGNVDLEVFVDDSSVYTGTDSSTPITSGNDGMYNAGGSRAVAARIDNFTDGSSSGFTIDTPPSESRAAVQASFVISGPATAPTTGNTTIKLVDGSGPSATIDSVSGSDPYTINYTFPKTTNKQFDETGYVHYITIDAESVNSSTIPYLPETNWDFVDVGTPDTGTDIYQEYAGDTFVSGDQCVWDTVSDPDSSTVTIDNTLNWDIAPAPTATQTVGLYRIAADDTKDVDDTLIFQSSTKFRDFLDSLPGGSSTKGLIAYLQGEGFTGSLNEMFVEFLKTKSSKASHTGRYQDWENNGFN